MQATVKGRLVFRAASPLAASRWDTESLQIVSLPEVGLRWSWVRVAPSACQKQTCVLW